jgi:hypothetical protein
MITFFSLSHDIVCHAMYCFRLHFFPESLHCLSYHVLFLITLLSLSHYIVCHTMYCFWLHFYLLAITLSLIPCAVSDYTFLRDKSVIRNSTWYDRQCNDSGKKSSLKQYMGWQTMSWLREKNVIRNSTWKDRHRNG